jgi:hypothetical protein
MAENNKYDCKESVRDKRFNVCQFVKAVSSSLLLAPITKKFLESASFELKCPFKVGEYFVRKMEFKIPPFFPFPNAFYCIDMIYFGKTKSLKKMEKYLHSKMKIQMKK